MKVLLQVPRIKHSNSGAPFFACLERAGCGILTFISVDVSTNEWACKSSWQKLDKEVCKEQLYKEPYKDNLS